MVNTTKIFITLTLIMFSSTSNADGEIDGWYLSKGGDYLVREAIDGSLHALLATSKSRNLSVYIVMFDPSCINNVQNVINHNPLYVNKKLVKYSQYCDGDARHFFPSTNAGRNHLIREFIKKDFVEIKTHDNSFTALFSAKGFTKIYNEIEF